jgi:hypothetical protein
MQVTGIPSPRVRMFSQIAFTESPCCCASERKTRRSSALVTFAQLFGGVLGIGVCGAVFANELASDLVKYAPDAPFALVRDSISAIYPLPVQQQADVIHGYVSVNLVLWAYDSESLLTSFYHKAVDKIFLVPVACGASVSLGALLIRNINIKGRAMGGMAA